MSIVEETRSLSPPPMSLILDRLSVGVILVDGALRVLEANAAAREILQEEDGLLVRRGALRTSHPPETQTLMDSVGARASGPSREAPSRILVITRPSGARPLHVVVFPLPQGAVRSLDAALFISDPDSRAEGNVEILRVVYGLTQAEAKLARQLAKGERLDEAARAMGITIMTARTHLKRILSKTETGRQADLIRLLLQGIGQIRLCLDQPAVASNMETGFKRAMP